LKFSTKKSSNKRKQEEDAKTVTSKKNKPGETKAYEFLPRGDDIKYKMPKNVDTRRRT
jgi:hypothetical protein